MITFKTLKMNFKIVNTRIARAPNTETKKEMHLFFVFFFKGKKEAHSRFTIYDNVWAMKMRFGDWSTFLNLYFWANIFLQFNLVLHNWEQSLANLSRMGLWNYHGSLKTSWEGGGSFSFLILFSWTRQSSLSVCGKFTYPFLIVQNVQIL